MTTIDQSLIRCQDVSYTQGNKVILENIGFEISNGNIITIIGPNGGGKTTLLKILLGILNPTQGLIYRKKGLRTGYMPQKLVFNRQLPMTVRNFLFLNHNQNQDINTEQVTLDTNLQEILDQQVHEISGGELQRLMLAKALLHDPDLMILDEPVQGLDIRGQHDFYLLLEKIRKEQKISILMVSHDLHTVMRSTNHVICLNKHICCEGLPEAIKDQSYEHLFGLEDADVLAYYPHHNHHQEAHK